MTTLEYAAPALAFLASFAMLVWMLRSRPAWLPLDRPNTRSLHRDPVPRAGGLAILLGAVVGCILAGTWGVAWAVIVLFLAAVSWVDDRRGLPATARLGVQTIVAILFLWISGQDTPWVTFLFAALAIVWMTNIYNFMDGSDGLAGGMAVIGFGCYAIAAWMAGHHQLSLVCWCLVAGTLAFLVFNVPPAKIFMGDIGSVPFGFLAAAIGFFGWQEEFWPIWFPFLVFSFFIVDATVTLLRRAVSGARFWEPHRDHAYQRLIRSGWSHRHLMLTAWSIMFLTGTTALVLLGQPAIVVTASLAGWVMIDVGLLIAVDAHWRLSAVGHSGGQ
ncbi:MAG TPA: glycosyltransferase family 4 protein [Burkholderiales bacterium]|nr:glycosyltransferase family 4 protein [Burkholderiales bacterium]